MGGNRTETRPLIVKNDAEKADVSIGMDETASPAWCKIFMIAQSDVALFLSHARTDRRWLIPAYIL